MSRWAFAVALVLFAGPVYADAAADIAAARSLGIEGVKLADAGNCAEAVDKLARAEALHHAPTILGRLGECQVELGKLVEGTEHLQKVVREPLAPNAPAAFVAAVERAKKVLAVAQPKIAQLTLVIEPATATVTIDGVAISAASIGTPRPIDPGAHEITVSAPGFTTATSKIVLAVSEVRKLERKLEPVPVVEPKVEPKPVEPAVAPPPPPPVAKPAPPTKDPPEPTEAGGVDGRTVAWVALGIGAAGLISGATFGIVALDARNSLDHDCPDRKCPPDAEKQLDDANDWATLSTVGFVVAGAGAGVSAFLFATTPSKPAHASIAPVLGLGSLGLRGVF